MLNYMSTNQTNVDEIDKNKILMEEDIDFFIVIQDDKLEKLGFTFRNDNVNRTFNIKYTISHLGSSEWTLTHNNIKNNDYEIDSSFIRGLTMLKVLPKIRDEYGFIIIKNPVLFIKMFVNVPNGLSWVLDNIDTTLKEPDDLFKKQFDNINDILTNYYKEKKDIWGAYILKWKILK